jgi:hypothetical protein
MISTRLQSVIKIRLRKEGYHNEDTLSEYIMAMLSQNEPQSVVQNELLVFLGRETASAFTNWLFMMMQECNTHGIFDIWPLHNNWNSKERHLIKLNKNHRLLQNSLKQLTDTTINERSLNPRKRLRELDWNTNEENHIMHVKDNMLKIVVNKMGLIYNYSESSLMHEKRLRTSEDMVLMDKVLSTNPSFM